MKVRFYIFLLLIIFAIGVSQRESFAPLIPSPENQKSTINTNETAFLPRSIISDNFWFILVIIGISIICILIIIVFLRKFFNNRI